MLVTKLGKAVLVVTVLFIAACSQEKPSNTQTPTPNIPSSEAMMNAGMRAGMPQTPATIQTTNSGEKLSVVGIQFALPAGWIKETPRSSMRLAQYRLPGDAGPAELNAFSFGVGMGGGTPDNIDRWAGQFSTSQGKAKPQVTSFDQGGLKITVVEAAGTYTGTSMGPMQPASAPELNYALYGLIVEGGSQGNLFIKVTGPAGTISAHSKELEAFARSASLSGS